MNPRGEDRKTVGTTGLRSGEIDSIKGVYIILIVFGHNVLFTHLFPELRNQLFSFHVAGFLVFPFLFRPGQFSYRFIADRAVRYLVPYAVFYTGCALLYATLISRPDSIASWSMDYFRGLLLGSDPAVKAGSGFALFWFLPTMLTLTLMRAVAASGRVAQTAVLAACLALHLTAGAAPAWAKVYVPWGILIAAYMYPLGVLLETVWSRFIAPNPAKAGIAAIVVLAVCVSLSVTLDTGINLGKVRFYAWDNIPAMLLHDAYILSAFIGIAGISSLLAATRLLPVFGRYSLVIYLIHSPVFQLLLVIARKTGIDTANLPAASVVLLLTLLLSTAAAAAIHGSGTLRAWITPRDAAQWPVLRSGC